MFRAPLVSVMDQSQAVTMAHCCCSKGCFDLGCGDVPFQLGAHCVGSNG